jgi:transcriptional regulator with XRE-family HTH domain
MRFQFLKPRKDVASAEQVRALRELRGWTVEQLADEVHASPLEVSAWEAGKVRVPSRQALLIRWHTERAAWSEALRTAQERTCPWVRENAPDLYEQLFRKPAGSRYTRDEPVRAHLAGCARCSDVRNEAQRIGGFPAKPDTSGSLRARYWRWVERLPSKAQRPFMVAGLAVGSAVSVSFVALWAPDLWVGFLVGWVVFWATIRVSFMGMAWVVPTLAGLAAGLLGWSMFPGNSLTDPHPWLAVGGFATVIGVAALMASRDKGGKARALAAGGTHVAQADPGAAPLLGEPAMESGLDSRPPSREHVPAAPPSAS